MVGVGEFEQFDGRAVFDYERDADAVGWAVGRNQDFAASKLGGEISHFKRDVRVFGGSLALGQEASSAAQARRADGADARPTRMGTTVRNDGRGVVVPVQSARAARSEWLSAAFWLRSSTTRPEAVHRFRM